MDCSVCGIHVLEEGAYDQRIKTRPIRMPCGKVIHYRCYLKAVKAWEEQTRRPSGGPKFCCPSCATPHYHRDVLNMNFSTKQYDASVGLLETEIKKGKEEVKKSALVGPKMASPWLFFTPKEYNINAKCVNCNSETHLTQECQQGVSISLMEVQKMFCFRIERFSGMQIPTLKGGLLAGLVMEKMNLETITREEYIYLILEWCGYRFCYICGAIGKIHYKRGECDPLAVEEFKSRFAICGFMVNTVMKNIGHWQKELDRKSLVAVEL